MLNETPKLKTNLDTDFLKLIAVISMLIDHVGSGIFPQYPVFRWIGRIAFPIFCYCLTVGLLYTHDIKRYVGRLMLFAIISQPFYALKVDPHAFWRNLTNWNIFFTLTLSLLFMWGVKQKRAYSLSISALCLLMLGMWNFDYGYIGVILMLIFYFCRNNPFLGAMLFFLYYLPSFWGDPANFLNPIIGGHVFDVSIFALLAIFPIFCPTHTKIKFNKWFFYLFYPVHLAMIALIKIWLGI